MSDLLLLFEYLLGINLVVFCFFKWKFRYWSSRNVPNISPIIPYGNIKGVSKVKHSLELFDEVYSRFKSETPFAGIYMTIFPAIVITNLDLAQDILIKDFNSFRDRPLYFNESDDPISAHLIVLRGSKWKRLRGLLTPAFSTARLKSLFPIVHSLSHKLVETISKHIMSDSVIDVQDIFSRFTTDVIGSSAFGVELNSLDNPDDPFRMYGNKFLHEPRYPRFWYLIFGKYPKLANALHFKCNPDDVGDFFLKTVKDTVAYRQAYNVKRNDLLDLLISFKERGELTLNDIAAQVYIFYLAGFETSSATLSFAIFEMAFHPAIQDKARQSISETLEKYHGEISFEAVKEMQYLDQIINETLRKYTVAPRLIRYAAQDYALDNSQLVIQKGTPVFIPTYSIHYDPDIYPNPEIFDPNRFEPKEVKNRHPMSFLAFGEGPRYCIGAKFGRMEIKIALVKLLTNFEFHKCKETPKQPLRYHPDSEVLTPIERIKVAVRKI